MKTKLIIIISLLLFCLSSPPIFAAAKTIQTSTSTATVTTKVETTFPFQVTPTISFHTQKSAFQWLASKINPILGKDNSPSLIITDPKGKILVDNHLNRTDTTMSLDQQKLTSGSYTVSINNKIITHFTWGNHSAYTSWLKNFISQHPDHQESDIVKRDKYSTHFKRPDGTIEAQIVSSPINFLNPKGQWQTIDTTISSSTSTYFDYQNTTNSFETYFSSDAYSGSSNIKLVKGNAQLSIKTISTLTFVDRNETLTATSLSPQNEAEKNAKKGIVDPLVGNKFCYPNLFKKDDKTIDACYLIQEGRIREQLILNSYLGFPELTQKLTLSNAVVRQEDGRIAFYNATTNEFLWYILDPVIYEQPTPNDLQTEMDQQSENRDLHYQLTCDQTGIPLEKCTNLSLVKILEPKAKNYLADPQRHYPVVIDPDYSESTEYQIGSGYVADWATARGTADYYSSNPANTNCGNSYYPHGTPTVSFFNYRNFYNFDTSSIGSGNNVTQVNLKLTNRDRPGSYSSYPYDLILRKYNWSTYEPVGSGNYDTVYDGCLSVGDTETNPMGNPSNDSWATDTQYTSGNLDTTWVNTTGNTYYCMLTKGDLDNVSPADYGPFMWSNLYGVGSGTSSYRPVLTVTYEAGPTPTPTDTPTPTPTPQPGNFQMQGVRLNGIKIN